MTGKIGIRSITVRIVIVAVMLLTIVTFSNTTVSAATQDKYPYLIKINKRMNTVTVYRKDSAGNYTVPIKAMVCSTGNATPIGTFKTPAKYRWKILMDDVWGQYSTRITGGILFHSVWYYKRDPSTLSVRQYNRLGTTASHGCVRLTTVDAKWIYDNCSLGTTVVIYNSSNPGPLGKPEPIKLSGRYTWDPTDTFSKNNPYNKMKPKITGASNKTVSYLSKVDLKKGIKAYNTTGYDVTRRLKVSGTVNTSKPGKYKVTYSVTDQIGRTAKKTVTYTVLGNAATPTLKGVTTKVYSYNSYKNTDLNKYVYNGISAYIGKEKLDSKDITYKAKVVENSDSLLKYKITYTAMNPYSKKKVSKVGYIVLDKKAPSIQGDSTLYLTPKAFTALKNELKAGKYSTIAIQDNYSKASKLSTSYTLSKKSDTYYTLVFTVLDEAKNKAKKTVKIYLLNSPKLNVEASTIEIGSLADLTDRFILSKVTFTASGIDYTSKFKKQIQYKKEVSADGTTITVRYSLPLRNAKTITAKINFVIKQEPPATTEEPIQEPTQEPTRESIQNK